MEKMRERLMTKCTTIVTRSVRDDLLASKELLIVRDVPWCDNLRYIQIYHPKAPDGRHVDVILDESGLRFKPDQDV